MDQLNRAERTSHEQIELFLRFDRVGTAAGLLAAVLANAVIVREPAVYFLHNYDVLRRGVDVTRVLH